MRRTGERFMEASIFHEAGFQPSLQDAFVHRSVFDEPFMVDVIETPFNICLQHPVRLVFLGQGVEALLPRILG